MISHEDCWIYLGPFRESRGGAFYGKFAKGDTAHRASYRTFKGDIPEGLTIDHLCRNTVCVNPDHLEAVTLKVNILRSDCPPAMNARKAYCKNGHALDRVFKSTGYRYCSICKNANQRVYQNAWNRRRKSIPLVEGEPKNG